MKPALVQPPAAKMRSAITSGAQMVSACQIHGLVAFHAYNAEVAIATCDLKFMHRKTLLKAILKKQWMCYPEERGLYETQVHVTCAGSSCR